MPPDRRSNLALIFTAGMFFLIVWVPPTASSQCPAPTWSSMQQLPGLDGPASAVTTWDQDGPGPAPAVMVVGGIFSTAGGVTAHAIATWDGVAWSALSTGFPAVPFASPVTALTVYNGALIVAGNFTAAGGVPANSIASWNGTTWTALGTGFAFSPFEGPVKALTVYNGELIAAGSFTAVGGVQANNIARWNGSSWSALGTGIPSIPPASPVTALAVHFGELIATGNFTTAGGVPANNIARWNGSSWQSLGTGLNGVAQALTEYNGDLIAGGVFSVAGGVTTNRIARWDGSAWLPIGAGMNGTVYSLTTHNGGLVAAGAFTTAGGVNASSVALWNGSAWSGFGLGISYFGPGTEVRAFTQYGSDLIAVGGFSFVGTSIANSVARWNGAEWQAISGMDGGVSAMTVSYGDLFVGGYFTIAGGNVANHIIRWNGSSWQSQGSGFDDSVFALTVYNQDLVATGAFTTAGGIGANHIARWAGSSWVPIGTGLLGPGVPSELAVYNGELIAAGGFAVPAGFIARWNGSFWLPLGTGMDSFVGAVCVYNGELIAGGQFSNAGGTSVAHIARWNGSFWQPLGAGVTGGINPLSVFAMTVYNGELVAGGRFTTAGGGPVNNIARWNGSLWSPLGTGMSSTSGLAEVLSLTVHDGQLIAGGHFTSAGGIPVSNIARWNGSAWQPLGTGAGPVVSSLIDYEGALFVGGTFSSAGGFQSPYLARWSSPLPLISLSQPSGAGTGTVVTNRWLIPGHEYYNIVSFDVGPGGPGGGPYGGLWFNDVSILFQQLLLPTGALPFHFVAPGSEVTFGPYPLPAGLYFEVISGDVTGGTVGCLSPVKAFTVY